MALGWPAQDIVGGLARGGWQELGQRRLSSELEVLTSGVYIPSNTHTHHQVVLICWVLDWPRS